MNETNKTKNEEKLIATKNYNPNHIKYDETTFSEKLSILINDEQFHLIGERYITDGHPFSSWEFCAVDNQKNITKIKELGFKYIHADSHNKIFSFDSTNNMRIKVYLMTEEKFVYTIKVYNILKQLFTIKEIENFRDEDGKLNLFLLRKLGEKISKKFVV